METKAEYGDVYDNNVRRLSRGKVLKRFLDLRQEIEIFMIEKGKTVSELKNNNWLWDLAFLTDVTTHLNIFNFKLQGPGKLIFDKFNTVKVFETKLKLFVNQIGNSDFSHFENFQQFKNEIKLLCLKNRFVKCCKNCNYSSQFVDVKLHKKSFRLFENPFSIDENNVDSSNELELIEL